MTPAPDDLRTAYEDHVILDRGPNVSEIERVLMVDTLLAVGPDAPTLSGDWTTHQLVAHLVLRESNPVGSIKAAVPKIGQDAVDQLAADAAYEDLVGAGAVVDRLVGRNPSLELTPEAEVAALAPEPPSPSPESSPPSPPAMSLDMLFVSCSSSVRSKPSAAR